jgi:hypothetical protein
VPSPKVFAFDPSYVVSAVEHGLDISPEGRSAFVGRAHF